MRDMRSEFYKIGFSINPVYREKTLQAEQPLILLVDSWEGTLADEKQLHKLFTKVRVRGEWFALTKEHLSEIYRYFYDRSRPDTNNHLSAALNTIRLLERDVYIWKTKCERAENELQTLKSPPQPKFIIPGFDSNEAILPLEEKRKSLLESSRLARLPALPKRGSYYPPASQDEIDEFFPNLERQRWKVENPAPGITLRLNDGNPQPTEYSDTVPF